jgi:hypothetical protein
MSDSGENPDLENSKFFLDQLGPPQPRTGGNPAAEWRLRVKRQNAIDDRLRKLGSLALLSGSSLLVTATNGVVQSLERHSNWRTTLKESPIWTELSQIQQGQLTGAKRDNYLRLETALQSFGQLICLAVSDLEERELIVAFSRFKVECVMHAFASDRTLDEVLTHIKNLGKICQACLLGTKIEPIEGNFCPIVGTNLLPFLGKTMIVNEFYQNGRRNRSLSYKESFLLAQIGQLPRALPYPSKDQVIKSLKETFDIIQTPRTAPSWALKEYKMGLNIVKDTIPKLESKRTHVSLLASGARENPRSEGGRARYLVRTTRNYGDRPYTPDDEFLVNKLDQFGNKLIHYDTWTYLKDLDQFKTVLPIANIMFVRLDEIPHIIHDYKIGRTVPKHLGHLLNLSASMLIREIGDYIPAPAEYKGIMYFESTTKFHCTDCPIVRADISSESGMKTRLITAAQAAFSHLSQLPANYMRSYLSQDPFHRVGFQESDKLWEVLKTYQKSS